MAVMASSGTGSPPLGRAAMSVSFRRAMIMRMVEVRGASPARMEAFIASVKLVRRVIGGF